MKYLFGVIVALLLVSCAPSPHIAFSELEGIKGAYQDPKLAALDRKYKESLQDIYARYRQAGVDIYKEGIGFTKLSDKDEQAYYYLMVFIKPAEISFDGNTTTQEQRLRAILKRHFEPNMRYLKIRDLEKDDMDGLAFGIYWPVRDYNECSKQGGYLEYAVAYLKKADVIAFLNRTASFTEIAKDAEIVVSQGLKDSVPIRLVD
jgi:hypothetical protein